MAARAPDGQAAIDRHVIDQYLSENKEIASTVNFVDYKNFIIHYSNDCKIIFTRDFNFGPLIGLLFGRAWVGGATDLSYSETICSNS